MEGRPPLHTASAIPITKIVDISSSKESLDLSNSWMLAAIVGGILVLYSLSRIISMQRRLRDLEARPPVDDIVMRGMIRHEVNEIVGELETSLRARESFLKQKESVHLKTPTESTWSQPPETKWMSSPEAAKVVEVKSPQVVELATETAPSFKTTTKPLSKESSLKSEDAFIIPDYFVHSKEESLDSEIEDLPTLVVEKQPVVLSSPPKLVSPHKKKKSSRKNL
jgi:hypothetical protein